MPLALMLAGAGADVSPAAAAPSLIETDLTSAWRGGYVIPAARKTDSSGISGGWYRARGWWGGRAPNETDTNRPWC